LPADARLPGAYSARLADAEAERNPARPGRTPADGTRGPVERQAGKSLPSLPRRVGTHPVVHAQPGLDAAATENDVASRSLLSGAVVRLGGDRSLHRVGRLGVPGPNGGPRAARSPLDRGDDGRPEDPYRHGLESPLARPTVARSQHARD